MPDVLLYAYSAAFLVALISGPLGAFVTWQGVSFWGHTLAHSALIGVACSLFFHIDPLWGLLGISALFSVLLSFFYRSKGTSRDSWMAFTAHGSLALSLILISHFPEAQRYVATYLFGDILALSEQDVLILALVCLSAGGILFFLWKPLLRLTLHEEIASLEGTPISLIRTIFLMLLSCVVAVSLKILGGLLITSLLIIPAVTARRFASSPEQMAILASGVALFSVIGGMEAADTFDFPPAASIVTANLGLFALSRLFCWKKRGRPMERKERK